MQRVDIAIRYGYKNALYLGIRLAAEVLVITELFVRIKKDVRQGWNESKEDKASERALQVPKGGN
jgi:hypothetical protein